MSGTIRSRMEALMYATSRALYRVTPRYQRSIMRLIPAYRRRDDELDQRLWNDAQLAMAEHDMAAGWETIRNLPPWPDDRPLTTDTERWPS